MSFTCITNERACRSDGSVYYATIFLATLIVIGVRQFAQYLWKRTNCYKSALSTPARIQCHVLFKTAALITDSAFFPPCTKKLNWSVEQIINSETVPSIIWITSTALRDPFIHTLSDAETPHAGSRSWLLYCRFILFKVRNYSNFLCSFVYAIVLFVH